MAAVVACLLLACACPALAVSVTVDETTTYTVPAEEILRLMDVARIMERDAVDMVVYYTFPRHQAMETFALEQQMLRVLCEQMDVELKEQAAHDPTGTMGEETSRQFLIDDLSYIVFTNTERRIGVLTTCTALRDALRDTQGLSELVSDLSTGGEAP